MQKFSIVYNKYIITYKKANSTRNKYIKNIKIR